jgi:hypothetical protein
MAVDMPDTPPTAVQLIPWDPDSPDHLQRLVLQRLACGWDNDYVTTKWRDLQRKGSKSIQWIVSILRKQAVARAENGFRCFPHQTWKQIDS